MCATELLWGKKYFLIPHDNLDIIQYIVCLVTYNYFPVPPIIALNCPTDVIWGQVYTSTQNKAPLLLNAKGYNGGSDKKGGGGFVGLLRWGNRRPHPSPGTCSLPLGLSSLTGACTQLDSTPPINTVPPLPPPALLLAKHRQQHRVDAPHQKRKRVDVFSK